MRNALNGCRPGADNPDTLVLEPVQAARIVTTGIAIVPATGVEGVALKRRDAGNARQLGPVQRAIRHRHILGLESIAPIGGDHPGGLGLVPLHLADAGLQQGVVIEAVMARDIPTVFQDFGGEGVFMLWHIAQLFKERQVAIRLHVAHGSGIAVPIPSAAKVPG